MTLHDHDDEPRYCTRCGGPLIATRLKTTEPERPVCSLCGRVVYLDPKVAVGTIIKNAQHEIALVRRSIEPGYGKWVFPGGYVDRGELLVSAAKREALEESRLHIRIDGLVNIYSYAGRIPVIIVYAATHVGGELHVDAQAPRSGDRRHPGAQHAERPRRLARCRCLTILSKIISGSS